MKKVLCLAAVAALVSTASVSATDLTLAIVAPATATPGLVDYQITGSLDGSEGLALVGFDVDHGGDAISALAVGAGMEKFVTDEGLTNPDGYGGTASGTTMLQVGGGQNTIGNTSDNAPYPIADPIDLGVAVPGPQVLAEGSFTMGAVQVCINVTNCFANVITSDTGGPIYPVESVGLCNGVQLCVDPGGIDYSCEASGFGSGPTNQTCPDSDVNCDGAVNGGDIGPIVSGLNWFKNEGDPPAQWRADVNRDKAVNGGDIGPIVSGVCWFQLP